MPLTALPGPSNPVHSLFSSRTDSVPTLDELMQLERELKTLHAEATSRKDIADAGSVAVNEFWKRAKDRVKELGRERPTKSKEVERIKSIKIKRETGSTPDVEDIDARHHNYPNGNGHGSKGYSSRGPFAVPPTTYKKSKSSLPKKRKQAESDGEMSDNPGSSHPHKFSKTNGSSKSTGHGNSHGQTGPRIAEDFSLPNREAVPPRPNLATLSIFPYLHQTPDDSPPKAERASLSRNNSNVPPPIASSPAPSALREDVYAARSAMNSNPYSVMEDFSAARPPPNQTTIHALWTAAESYIKPLGIEDLANLELEGDDVQPYEFVPLGRHYLDRWDDEDTQAFAEELGAPASSLPSISANSAAASALSAESQAPWDPTSIGPSDLVRDERSLGTVRARLLAAFLSVPGGVVIGKEEGAGEGDEREKERRTGTGSVNNLSILEVPDLEDRLRAEASAIGLLGDDSEPIMPMDDEIASSLRRLQRLLRAQSTLNASRKRLLKERADEGLALAEYRSTLRQTLDKPIVTAYTKIQRAIAAKPGKKGKNKSSGSAPANGVEENLSTGGIPLELPLELMKRVRLRERFVETIGGALRDEPTEEDEAMNGPERKQPQRRIAMVHFPTQVLLPERSIYEGVEEEVEKEVGWPFQSAVAGAVVEPRPAMDGHSLSNGTNGTVR